MFYLTITVLVLVLQTTLTTITALEHFAAVPRDEFALLPRMETLPLPGKISRGVGFDESMYIETHPCANSFNPKLSLRFTTHPSTLMGCTKIKFSVAWWPKATKFECIPMRKSSRKEATALNINSPLRSNIDHPGYCFTFEPLDGNQDAGEWHHPCENLHHTAVSDSLWYTTWKGMTYEECRYKPNAGAWSVARYHSVSGCFVFFGSPEVWRKPVDEESRELGRCFVLDKVPVFQSYVEVHPCDKFFHLERSELFSLIAVTDSDPPGPIPSTFAECTGHPKAVAWAKLDPLGSECVPISKPDGQMQLPADQDREQVRKKPGLCFKFNEDKAPKRARGGNIREPYKHVCEDGFKAEYSRWYSSLPKPMTLKDCESKANTAAWRKTTTCLVFYWYSKIPPGIEKLKGTCFIRDKVVPLGSVHPPPHIVTKHEYPLLNA